MSESGSTIHISIKVRKKLEKLKRHRRETWNDVLERLVTGK